MKHKINDCATDEGNYICTACKDRFAQLSRWAANVYQDSCENAYVEVSLLDAALQALSEVAPDHPLLKGKPPSFGVWQKLNHENQQLKEELNALRPVMSPGE